MALLCEAKVGQAVEVTLSFFDVDGTTAKDVTDPTANVLHPDGTTEDTYTGGQITHVSTGVYTFIFTPSKDGKWFVHGSSSTPMATADEGYVLVLDSQFS